MNTSLKFPVGAGIRRRTSHFFRPKKWTSFVSVLWSHWNVHHISLILAGVLLTFLRTAGAVDATVTLNVGAGLVGPLGVRLAVSTFPVTNPATAFNSSVFLASTSVFIPSVTATHAFTNLPLITTPTAYYFYAHHDSNQDSVIGSTEPRGGNGPFPDHQLSAVMTATSQEDSGTASLTIFPRAAIEGTVTVQGEATGQRIIILTNENIGNPNPDYAQKTEFSLSGGAYVLGGLKPTGFPYRVEAWIDKSGGVAGEWDDNEIRQVLYPGAPVPGGTINGQHFYLAGDDVPDHIRLTGTDGSSHQSIVAGEPSAEIRVFLRNSHDEAAISTSPIHVNFSLILAGANETPELSIDGGPFEAFSGPLVISSSQPSSVPIRLRPAVSGQMSLRAEALDVPRPGESSMAWHTFDVYPPGTGFQNVGVRTTSQAAGVLSATATFTPDRDGIDDGVVFACTPPAASSGWELLVSTEPSFGTGVFWRYYGYGSGEAYWHGYGQTGRIVPSGTYYARFQTPGQGMVSSSMLVTVQAAAIAGVVLDQSENPVREAEVNIYSGNGGGFELTDANGRFLVNGLKPSSSYQIELRKTGYLTVRLSTTTGAAAESAVDLGNQILPLGVNLAVNVTVSSAPTRDIYGGVSVYDQAHTDQQWGTVRIASGATLSDNGRYSGDPQFSTWTLVSVRPDTDYTIEINLPDFGRSTHSWRSPSSGTDHVSFSMARKANVYGKVRFSNPVNSMSNGEWVSVDAQLSGATMPIAWGGVWVNNGMTEGVYTLFGVAPGTYRLRAFARGYVSSTATVTVGSGDFGNITTGGADFAPFETGGQITGTITVAGDSTGVTLNNGYGCGQGQFALHVNAWSRNSYMGASGQACLTPSATSSSGTFLINGLSDGTYEIYSYLQGFELDTTAGAPRATVTAGVGQKNINFDALTGQLNIQAHLPAGDDGAMVNYRLERGHPNPNQWSGMLSGASVATATLSGLGTGLYTLRVENQNPGRGLQVENVLAIKNGATVTAPVDLTIPAFAVTGEIKVQGSVVLPSPWSVTVSSAAGLAAAGVTPQIDIFALPFPNHFDYSNSSLQTVSATVHESSATYHIPALAPGGYWVHAREDLNPPSQQCNGCWGEAGLPELANEGTLLYVGTAPLTGVDLTLTNGVRVAGTISRPNSDTSTDSRRFVLRLRRSDNYTQWGSSVTTDADGSANFSFPHIGPGAYILEVTEEGDAVRYGAKPVSLTVASADVTLAVPLVAAGTIIGRLRDADSQTLLTADNVAQYLPDNFNIAAQANPWVPGGYVQALRANNSSMYAFDSDGKFRIPRVIPGTNYDLTIRGFEGLTSDALARGIRPYAPTVLAGIQVTEGQTVDVGTIDLKQGGALSGKVTDTANQPLANIRIVARPSIKTTADTWSLQVETFTDENGRFSLQGIDRNQRYYDVVASPRFRYGETYAKLAGPRYAEERRRMIDVNDAAKLSGNDFTLSLANGVLEGHVSALDGGVLYPSFTDKGDTGERGADIVLHRKGAVFDDNPLGEIEERTSPDGTFRIEGLNPGSYTFRALAVGYVTALQTIEIPSGTKDLGLIELGRGATVSGPITKPDGTAPSSSEVSMVLGIDENFEDFLFGTMDVDDDTQQVNGYSISGFKTNTPYSLVIVTEKDDIMEVKSGVTFSQTNESLVIPLDYRPAGPRVFVNHARAPLVDNGVTYQNTSVRFFVTKPLRNLTVTDSDVASLVSVSSGAGVLYNLVLNSARDTITGDYKIRTDAQEPFFSLALRFFTNEKDPTTGDPFAVNDTFTFHAGVAARRSATVSNVTGGDCVLEGEATGVSFLSGAFDVAVSSSVEVELRILDSLPTAGASASQALPGRRSPRPSGAGVARIAQALGQSAYPSATLFAAANAAASVNPFSAFYDIFLPAGISHLLKKDALLTLTYDPDSGRDPADLNIYFYDPNRRLFLLEKTGRVIDEVNHTLTVSVGHLSTFLVLNSQAPVIVPGDSPTTYDGQAVQVYNVPNPFRLGSKRVTLTHAEPADATPTVEGTLICYALPAGKTGSVKIEIYDGAGTRVRSLTDEATSGGTYNRLEWDGRNDEGRRVASGVYLARFTLNGGDEKMFKMALLK
jgi:hypothetical protein